MYKKGICRKEFLHSPHPSNGNVPVGLNRDVEFKICSIFDTVGLC